MRKTLLIASLLATVAAHAEARPVSCVEFMGWMSCSAPEGASAFQQDSYWQSMGYDNTVHHVATDRISQYVRPHLGVWLAF